MPAKISEKKLLIGITSLVTGILIFIKTTIIAAPVPVSGKGVLSAEAALFFLQQPQALYLEALFCGANNYPSVTARSMLLFRISGNSSFVCAGAPGILPKFIKKNKVEYRYLYR